MWPDQKLPAAGRELMLDPGKLWAKLTNMGVVPQATALLFTKRGWEEGQAQGRSSGVWAHPPAQQSCGLGPREGQARSPAVLAKPAERRGHEHRARFMQESLGEIFEFVKNTDIQAGHNPLASNLCCGERE